MTRTPKLTCRPSSVSTSLEVTQQRYAPEAFHDFIGFQVSKPVLERAFQDTYGLPLNLVLTNEDLAIGTYRRQSVACCPR